jgi:NAD-dependent dihydropyrimidine dehydrogenase PreA subunit
VEEEGAEEGCGILRESDKEVRMAYKPEVDVEKCIGCGECVEICPVEVYEIQDEKSVVVNEEECVGCESCLEVCEEDAVTIEET